MTLLLVDTSNHDDDRGHPNWSAVRQSGIQVMLHKASEGDPGGYFYEDPYFGRNVLEARAAGLALTGGYHCISHGTQTSINRQVDWLLKLADTVGGYGSGWWMLDIEPFDELVSRGVWPRFDDVRYFEDRWDQLTGGWPLAHYIPRWFWSRTSIGWGGPNLAGLRGPLVSSTYPVSATKLAADLYQSAGGDSGSGWSSYGGKSPAIWQYGSTAQIPGLHGNCDVNAFRGSLDDLVALVTKGGKPMKLVWLIKTKDSPDVWLSYAMMWRRKVGAEHLGGVQFWIGDGRLGIGTPAVETVDDLDAFGVDIGAAVQAAASPLAAGDVATELIKQLRS